MSITLTNIKDKWKSINKNMPNSWESVNYMNSRIRWVLLNTIAILKKNTVNKKLKVPDLQMKVKCKCEKASLVADKEVLCFLHELKGQKN